MANPLPTCDRRGTAVGVVVAAVAVVDDEVDATVADASGFECLALFSASRR
jgi:hypothetical protein